MNELWLFTNTIAHQSPPRLFIEYAAFLGDFAIFFFFAHRLFEKKKYSFRIVNICVPIAAALFSLMNLDVEDFGVINCVIYELSELVFLSGAMFLIYKDKPAIKAAYTLLCLTLYAAIDIALFALSYGLMELRYRYYSISTGAVFLITFCVVNRLLRLAVTAFLCRYLRRLTAFGLRRSAGLLCYLSIFPFCGAALLGMFTAGKYKGDPIYYIMTSAAALLIIAVVFLIVRFFPKISRVLASDRSGTFSGDEPTSREQKGLSVRDMQKLRHDVKNNTATICALIDSGDKDEAKRLLTELSERLGNALGGGNKTNISAVDLTVEEKEKICKERGIILDIHAEPLPETKISPLDLSSVIANILDNAIEASVRCENPVITFRIFKYKSYLAISCENPIFTAPRVANGKLISQKPESGHGCGTEIINEICQSNNGRYRYEFDDKVFKAVAFLEL